MSAPSRMNTGGCGQIAGMSSAHLTSIPPSAEATAWTPGQIVKLAQAHADVKRQLEWFSVKLVAAQTPSSVDKPTNQRYSRLYSTCCTSCRSERMENNTCIKLARSSRSEQSSCSRVKVDIERT